MLKDQKELLSEFNAHGVEYLVVGGHAVNVHGIPRTTKDLDLFIRSEQPNGQRVLDALIHFGAPVQGVTSTDFEGATEQVFQIGVEPGRVDILLDIDGVSFEEAWKNRVQARVDGELIVPFIGREELIQNKERTGRTRDLADAEELREMERVQRQDGQSAGKSRIELHDASNRAEDQ